MESISSALLTALASGVRDEADKQAWSELHTLVSRPFRLADETPAVSSGETELVALEQEPNPERANTLSTVLAVRASLDPQFRIGLTRWHEQTRAVRAGNGRMTNTITGGTFHGPVLQGRDFSSVSFTTASPTAPAGKTATEH